MLLSSEMLPQFQIGETSRPWQDVVWAFPPNPVADTRNTGGLAPMPVFTISWNWDQAISEHRMANVDYGASVVKLWGDAFIAEGGVYCTDNEPSSKWTLASLNRLRETLSDKIATGTTEIEWVSKPEVAEGWNQVLEGWNQILEGPEICCAVPSVQGLRLGPGYTAIEQSVAQFATTLSPLADIAVQLSSLFCVVIERLISDTSRRDRQYLWRHMLAWVAQLIVGKLRSGPGLAFVTSIFNTERQWYLHHSAHPPAGPDKAVDGRFTAMLRRACFRPLPA